LEHPIKPVRREVRLLVKPENTAKAHPDLRQHNQRETLKPPAASPFVDDRPSRDAAKVDNPIAPRNQDISRNQDEHDLFGLGFKASTGTNHKIDSKLGEDQRSVSGVKGPPPRVGQTKAGGSPGRSAASRASAERAYLAELQRAIGRYQRFPEEARRSRRTGVVAISFVILADGRLQQVAIAQSSGFSDLDRAAMEALSRLSRFKPIPPEIGRGHWAIRVPIRFDLR
jgi:protein TonB